MVFFIFNALLCACMLLIMVGRRKAIGQNDKRLANVVWRGGTAYYVAAFHSAFNSFNSFTKSLSSYFADIPSRMPGWYVAHWPDIMRAIWNMVLPRGCAGCDVPDEVLCSTCCRALCRWQRVPFKSVKCGYRYACGIYAGTVRTAILSWKDHQDVACDTVFSDLIADLVVCVMRELAQISLEPRVGIRIAQSNNEIVSDTCIYDWQKPIIVVPLPSSRASMRKRGRQHMFPVAQAVAKALCAAGFPAYVANIVRMDAAVSAKSVQTANGSRGRSHRAAHAFRVDYRALPNQCLLRSEVGDDCGSALQVILIDDIVTTGSTMSSCASVLQCAGAIPVAAFSIACVPSKDARVGCQSVSL